MKHFTILLVLTFLQSCVPNQKPAQTIINYTDNSIQLVGDGNQVSSELMAQQTATPTQTTDNTTKSGAWIFWLIMVIGTVGSVVLLYWYQKKRLL